MYDACKCRTFSREFSRFMWALKRSPRAILSPSSSPPTPFRTVRSINCGARRGTHRDSFRHLNFQIVSDFGIQISSFPSPPSSLRLGPKKAFEYSKERMFSNTTRVPHIRRGRKSAGFRTMATNLRPKRASWACSAGGRTRVRPFALFGCRVASAEVGRGGDRYVDHDNSVTISSDLALDCKSEMSIRHGGYSR